MSGATYRIEAEWDPFIGKWYAKVFQLSNDMIVRGFHGDTIEAATHLARQFVYLMNTPVVDKPTQNFYVDDEGQDADAPHSVKA